MSGSPDERWMRLAIELAWQCPPSPTAYSVGAVLVDADGDEISRGFSREGGDPVVHAEESALGKLAADDPRLAGATIYSTLEPCSQRKSRPRTCTQLIIAAGLRRVVIAWREAGPVRGRLPRVRAAGRGRARGRGTARAGGAGGGAQPSPLRFGPARCELSPVVTVCDRL